MAAQRSPQASMNGESCGSHQSNASGRNASGSDQSNSTSTGSEISSQMDPRKFMLIQHTVNDEMFQNFASQYSHNEIETIALQMLYPTILEIAQEYVDNYVPDNLLPMMQGMAERRLLPGTINCTCPDERRNAGQNNSMRNNRMPEGNPGVNLNAPYDIAPRNAGENDNSRNNRMPEGNPGVNLNGSYDIPPPMEGAQNISGGFGANDSSVIPDGTEINPVTQLLINNPLFRAHIVRLCEGATRGIQTAIRQAVFSNAEQIMSDRIGQIVPRFAEDVISRGLIPFIAPCKCLQPPKPAPNAPNAPNEQYRDRSVSPVRFS